ncbi:hypothetical protein [Salinigranum marinum]|uniref:hypothetical protein n=1 Tax=Salinigranum marinum TaxID=1515595 RepID=UPI002989FFD8|nr:hypothetical protein [Salinigranum marinum]
MALTIDCVVARAIGVAGGLAFVAPAVGMWVVLGAVTANVPLPPGVEQFVESVIPVLQPPVPGFSEPTLSLGMLVLAGFFLISLFLVGLFVTLGALLKPDYTLNVRGGSARGGRP